MQDAGWNEDRLHRWLARRGVPRGVVGSAAHDAAVLRALAGARPVLCTDQCIAGVHFDVAAPARQVGWKAAARALSDLAATAATPRAVVLAVRAPAETPERVVRGWIEGARRAAAAAGCDLVGGDLAAAPGLAGLTATALGALEGRRRAPGRDRARAGQAVVLTGPVGGAGLGRHLRFEPRVDEGRALWRAGATAMMDVSDGLAWDLFRLARASGVALELDVAALPVHRDARRLARSDGRDALDHALHDGEDHELVATLSPRAARGLEFPVIGRVLDGRGLWLRDADTRRRWKPTEGGWTHGI